MNNVINMVRDFITGVTGIFVSLISLGVVAGIVFGNATFISDVVSNLVALISSLADAGLVGLIAAVILVGLFTDSK